MPMHAMHGPLPDDEAAMPAPKGPPMQSGAVAAGAPAGEPGADEADDGQPNVTAEEQAEYDLFVDRAYRLIYDQRALPGIFKRLGLGPDPIDNLSDTAVAVVMRVEDAAKRAGRRISPDVILHAGKEILEDLAQLAEKARLHDYTDEEIEGAFYRALDTYREIKGGRGELDKEGIGRDFQAMLEADKAGKLEEMLPGIGRPQPPPGASAGKTAEE